MIVDTGASLTSTVLVELHHHIGDTQVAAFRDAGGLPSLGIDVEPFCSGHMFREMQAALLFARGKEVRHNALRGNSPLQAIAGALARGAGMGDDRRRPRLQAGKQIGTLTPGKKADIVMLRANDINMAPVYDPIYSIVEIAGAGNVDTVIIDGIVRKKNGKLTIPGRCARAAPRGTCSLRRAHPGGGGYSRADTARQHRAQSAKFETRDRWRHP